MRCKYVVIFGPVKDGDILCEGERRIENAIALLLDSKTKTDKQAVWKFKGIRKKLEERAKEIRLCKILK